MACQMNSSNFPILTKITTNTPTQLLSCLLSKPKQTIHPMTIYCCNTQNQQEPITTTTTQTQPPKTGLYSVEFKTLGACKLGISRYPDFVYNAEGGIGVGTGTSTTTDTDGNSKPISVSFDIPTLYIPPLTGATTRFLGWPLPPFLKIDIAPQLFQGTIDEITGKVNLEFKAKFWFSVGDIYKAPPLVVETVLTSEESNGRMRRGKGKRLDREGKCRLVGVAKVDPIDDVFMKSFLGLPTECLAELNAIICLTGCQ